MVPNTDPDDTSLQSQPITDNPLNDLQNRKWAPSKQLSHCLTNQTRPESAMSGTPDEEVDYGVADTVENPHVVSDYEWSTQDDGSVH